MSSAVVYISIGNSDDKLTQAQWADFVRRVGYAAETASEMPGGQLHGVWLSAPDARWQNACWALQLPAFPGAADGLRGILADLAAEFKQESIAWALAPTTEFIAAAA